MEDKKKILIVEDESLLAITMEECLVMDGYEIVGIASSGEKAMEYAEKYRPDLVIMDIFLKDDPDGIQATEHINRHTDIPVIYLTGNTDSVTYKRAMETKHYGYYEKPMPAVELLTAVKGAFELIKFQNQEGQGN